jgi:aldehyde dehydrogenase (NAD(P)+)
MTASLSSRPRPAPAPVEVPEPSSRRQLDEAVARVQDGAGRFARASLEDRIALARSLQAGYLRVAEDTVRAACRNKGISLGTPLEGEEWALGPLFVVRQLRLVQQALLAIKHTGNTRPGKLGRTIDGRLTVEVFPAGPIDGLLYSGVRAEVHLQQGVSEAGYHASRARYYKAPDHAGRVTLILGAGNVDAIPAMDVITKLFNQGKACVLKMNPVNAYLGPYIECAFAEAVAAGYLAVVYGGAEAGEHLVNHVGVDEIHITGSDKTYDRLMWGLPGPEREARKAQNRPLLAKPITAELGNVSPVIVVPGPYSAAELAYQAEDVASGVTCNASFMCNANKVIITPRGWQRRGEFLSALERVLGATPVRKAYYPGAAERYRALTEGRSTLKTIGRAGADDLPWTLLPDLDAEHRQEKAFTTEPFCSIVSETQVGSDDPVEFLEQAVSFANDRLWGTLSAGLVVHPKSLKDPRIAEAVEGAIARLRYGVVSVNAWSGYVFAFGSTPWGAHPSSSPADIQSGTGWVHNTTMIEGIEKVVLRYPLTVTPKPPTFPSHRSADALLKRMTRLEENASWSRVPAVLSAAVRG